MQNTGKLNGITSLGNGWSYPKLSATERGSEDKYGFRRISFCWIGSGSNRLQAAPHVNHFNSKPIGGQSILNARAEHS